MNEAGLGGRDVWLNDDPTCRVVRNAWTGEIEGIAVWNPKTWTYDVVRPTGTLAAEIREAFARLIAEDIVDAIWPVSSTLRPPASGDQLLTIAEALVDPMTLVVQMIGAVAEVAALHAGFPPVVARVIGQVAGDLCRTLIGKDPAARRERAAQYLDFTFSAETGSLINCTALRKIAVNRASDAIPDMLGPDGRRSPRGPKPVPRRPPGQPAVSPPPGGSLPDGRPPRRPPGQPAVSPPPGLPPPVAPPPRRPSPVRKPRVPGRAGYL